MKKKLNLINLQKEEIKRVEMTSIKGGTGPGSGRMCGCFDDGVLFNRRSKRDGTDSNPCGC